MSSQHYKATVLMRRIDRYIRGMVRLYDQDRDSDDFARFLVAVSLSGCNRGTTFVRFLVVMCWSGCNCAMFVRPLVAVCCAINAQKLRCAALSSGGRGGIVSHMTQRRKRKC